MLVDKKILIIANSGRMLASLAKNAGLTPFVIDCFADIDTQILALECIKVNSLALKHIRTAFSIFSDQYQITYAIYGSGLEQHQQTLEFLQQNFNVLGNTLATFLAIQNKADFFSHLSQLQIPYPETCFTPPELMDDWLIKPLQGEGGLGIKKYKDVSDQTALVYWQKNIIGTSMSVLFVANSAEYKIIGFNKQYTTQLNENEFVFLGVISQPKISEQLTKCVGIWLTALVVEFSLQGINSLDFIVNENRCYVLEVNARPSASMQLYDKKLLSEHINSFNNGCFKSTIIVEMYQAYRIIFAENDIFIHDQVLWPSWVVDIPQAGSFIHTAMPICSIIAGGKNEQQVDDIMLLRQQQLKKLLQ